MDPLFEEEIDSHIYGIGSDSDGDEFTEEEVEAIVISRISPPVSEHDVQALQAALIPCKTHIFIVLTCTCKLFIMLII